jgi:hypothetical protein
MPAIANTEHYEIRRLPSGPNLTAGEPNEIAPSELPPNSQNEP